MKRPSKASIRQLATGVVGLDQVLGGGLPEFSFTLIAGNPGTGKTTLAHQIAFANATEERPALYFTVLGEPALKMLRYQQQMSFFDVRRMDTAVRFSNLSQEVLERDLGVVLQRIIREVQEVRPALVIVDSFRTVLRAGAIQGQAGMGIEEFVQHLALYLASWEATTFLVGEYHDLESRDNPVFTVADGIIWLMQSVQRNSIVRRLQVMKLRGQASMPGLHTFRITGDGLQVYPRIPVRPVVRDANRPRARISLGVPGLDAMLGGGILEGDAVLVAGPAGSGKTILASQFIAEGVQANEAGVIVVFEERPDESLARAQGLDIDLAGMMAADRLSILYLRPLDLSVDETLQEIQDTVQRLGAKRLVIDSLSGFELALAPAFREDFRESLYRMVGALTGTGVTVLMTVEVVEDFHELRLSPHAVSFLADDIILLRYVEIDAQLRKVLAVIKMRGSAHSEDLRAFHVGPGGARIGDRLAGYRGLLSGAPFLTSLPRRSRYPGLVAHERAVRRALYTLGEATVEVLGRHCGLEPPVVAAALGRLLELGYACRNVTDDGTVYLPVVRKTVR